MEQFPQKTATENQLASTHLKISLIKQLFHVNCLVAYPISDTMLEVWANTLSELEPEITPEVVKWIVDKMKLGMLDFDNRKGIQNIFEGFRKYISHKIKEENSREVTKWNLLFQKYNAQRINTLNGIF